MNAKKGVETAEFKTHQVHDDTLCLPRPRPSPGGMCAERPLGKHRQRQRGPAVGPAAIRRCLGTPALQEVTTSKTPFPFGM